MISFIEEMTTLSKSFGLSSSLKEEAMVTEKQGIVSILGSDCETAAPIRRTLSADMSSKQWLFQHGFSPLKKIASSDQFPAVFSSSDPPSSSSTEGEEEYEELRRGRGGQSDIWTSILEEENKKKQQQQQQQKKKEAEFSDMWSAIISQKAQQDPKNLPPPYIHPLVKRSASSLSGKSLEICTESLGSETGSDGFSSYPQSENGAAENDDKEEGQQGQEQERPEQNKYDMEDLHVVKYNNLAATSSKKSPPRSFPPPIPSLSNRGGASVHMKSHRDNGRLVLEAVSVPSQNKFRAQRQDGRLVLTLINRTDEAEFAAEKKQEEEKNDAEVEVEMENSDDVEVEQFEVEMENSEVHGDEVEKEEEEEGSESGRAGDGGWKEYVRFVMEEAPKLTSNGAIEWHRLALTMNTDRPMVLSNRNPTTTTTTSTTSWRDKFKVRYGIEEEEEVEEDEEQEVWEPIAPLTQSLPPWPPMEASSVTTARAAASLNAYENYWRPKPMSTARAALHTFAQKRPRINNNTQSCKEPRKALLFGEPFCIATS